MRKHVSLWIALLVCVLLSLSACSDELESNSVADLYRSTAQGLLDAGELDSAISTLEEGIQATQDAGLSAMLEEVKAQKQAAEDALEKETHPDPEPEKPEESAPGDQPEDAPTEEEAPPADQEDASNPDENINQPPAQADSTPALDPQLLVGSYMHGAIVEEQPYASTYKTLTIEWSNSGLLINSGFMMSLDFDNVWVDPSNLKGNVLTFSSTFGGGSQVGTHTLTFTPASESPDGLDTIYVDGDQSMPYRRGEFYQSMQEQMDTPADPFSEVVGAYMGETPYDGYILVGYTDASRQSVSISLGFVDVQDPSIPNVRQFTEADRDEDTIAAWYTLPNGNQQTIHMNASGLPGVLKARVITNQDELDLSVLPFTMYYPIPLSEWPFANPYYFG